MARLIEGMGKNSADEYSRIFLKRKEKGVDQFDAKRWNKLLKHYRGGRLIDLGCLDSLVPEIAQQSYPDAECWGIDVAEDAIKEMRAKFPSIMYEVGDVYKTKFPNNYFEYAVAGELIEHLDAPQKFVDETFRILKRGGWLALSTPKGETHAGEVDHERHLWSFEPEDIEKLLSSFTNVQITTMGSQYFPRYVYHFPTIIAYAQKPL